MMLTGDCLVQMRTLADNSIDAVVTDPPWNLRFMQKKWDYQLPSVEIWHEVMRVLKPGGHALICCGTRTQHRMVVNVEDAGFEVRDICLHIFGSGFPKSHNISIAIDKAAGEMGPRGKAFRTAGAGERSDIQGKNGVAGIEQHAGITPDAIKWAGWGSALKPAVELWTLVRKPLSEPTIAANVLKWGTGGLNIDASRIGSDGGKPNVIATLDYQDKTDKNGTAKFRTKNVIHDDTVQGRFPANLILGCACESDIHDEGCAVAMLDAQSGVSKSVGGALKNKSNIMQSTLDNKTGNSVKGNPGFGDTGGASRFFFIARSDKSGIVNKCELPEQSLSHGKRTESDSNNQSIDGYGNRLTGLFQPDTISTTETETGSTINFQILNASKLVPIGQCTLKIEKNISQSEALSIESVSVAENGECLIVFQNGLPEPIRGIVKNVAQNTLQNGELKTASIGTNTTETCESEQATDTIKSISKKTVSASMRAAANDTKSTPPVFSRFFYCAKASKGERNHGLEGMPEINFSGGGGTNHPKADAYGARKTGVNHHPTVKPIRLMEYLIRMITPPGGRVLDPFAGSGSTLVAAKRLGFEFIGIEIDAEYVAIAEKRVAAACL